MIQITDEKTESDYSLKMIHIRNSILISYGSRYRLGKVDIGEIGPD